MSEQAQRPTHIFTTQCGDCNRLSYYVGMNGDFKLDDPVDGKCQSCGKTESTLRNMEKIQLLHCSDCKGEIRLRIDTMSQDRMTGKVRCMECFAKRAPKKSKRPRA